MPGAAARTSSPSPAKELLASRPHAKELLASRPLRRVAVLGANGAMGYQCGAQFASAGLEVAFLARTREKAEQGLEGAKRSVRSSTVGEWIEVGSYDEDLERTVGEADLIFEAVAEDFEIKNSLFEKVDACRAPQSIVATVSSGLSITRLAAPRSESFRKNFLGLHFFNPPNVIVGTELIAGDETDPAIVDFVEAFATRRLGRVIVRASDTPAFAGNRVGFKVLNEVAQLAAEHGVVLMDRLIGPYTGRAMTPLATMDMVGWDVHRAIVDNVYENAPDEARATLALPDYMKRLMEQGVLGNKSGGGFYKQGEEPLALDVDSGDYLPVRQARLPEGLEFIDRTAFLHRVGDYRQAMRFLAEAPGPWAALVRKVLAGYIAYAFHRAGEVTETITGIDLIMGSGFNWAPPGVLVDILGVDRAVRMIEEAELAVPPILAEARRGGATEKFFTDPRINVGKFFVAR